MSTRVIQARNDEDILRAAAEGATALREGKLVAFATETVYGLAAAATNEEAMRRLRELKNRPDRPFSVHLGGLAEAGRYVRKMPDSARRLIERGWPGPVTLVVPTGGKLADRKLRRRRGLYERLCADDWIGLRCPDHALAAAMLRQVDLPVVAPSANLAGEPSPRHVEDVLRSLDGKIDLLIDSGPTRYGQDSTIVRCEGSSWSILRKGVHDTAAIRRMLTRALLFVCTGNTCRSPMAAGLAKMVLAEQFGCRIGEVHERGVEVISAGIFAADGLRATAEAIRAARERGADISRHRSQKLTRELIQHADMVFCMTESHVVDVLRLDPQAEGKVQRLDPHGDVSDPIGSGAGVYRHAADKIEKALRAVLDKGLP